MALESESGGIAALEENLKLERAPHHPSLIFARASKPGSHLWATRCVIGHCSYERSSKRTPARRELEVCEAYRAKPCHVAGERIVDADSAGPAAMCRSTSDR